MAKMTWQERELRETERLIDIASKVQYLATVLECAIKQDEPNRWIFQFDRYTISLRYDAWKDRITLYGNFGALHQYKQSGDTECYITISPGKTVEKMARDIQARLIPECEELAKLLTQRQSVSNKRLNDRSTLAETIAASGNGKVTTSMHGYQPHSESAYARFGSNSFGEPWGKAEIQSYGGLHVTMELRNVPPELAAYIASLFGEYNDNQS